MTIHELVLRCYAEPDPDGTWFAICLDLNLYARGDSYDEARTKLTQVTVAYLHEALERDVQYFEDLVPRRAPWIFWLRYLWATWLNALTQGLASTRKYRFVALY